MDIEFSRGESIDGDSNSAPWITTIRMSSQLHVGGTFSAITTIPIPCADAISKNIDQLADTIERHIPEAQKDLFRESISSSFTDVKKRELTLGDIISIISLLLSLFCRFADSFPDEQMQKVISQNEIIISQQQEELRLTKERNAMLQVIADSIENISDLIEAAPEGMDISRETINTVRDFFDGADETADREHKFDVANSQ